MKSKKMAMKKSKPNGLYLARIDVGTQPPAHVKTQLSNARKDLKDAFKNHGRIIVTGYQGDRKGFIQIEVIHENTI